MTMQKGFIQLSLMGYLTIGFSIIVLSLGIALKVQTSRLESCQENHTRFLTEVERLGNEAQVKVKQEIERQKKVTKDASTDYETRLNLLRDTYARLRDQRSGSGSMPSIPNAPRSIDEVSADSIPLAGICAETTQQLNSLQAWVKAQSQ
jgi:hypothetical protein